MKREQKSEAKRVSKGTINGNLATGNRERRKKETEEGKGGQNGEREDSERLK